MLLSGLRKENARGNDQVDGSCLGKARKFLFRITSRYAWWADLDVNAAWETREINLWTLSTRRDMVSIDVIHTCFFRVGLLVWKSMLTIVWWFQRLKDWLSLSSTEWLASVGSVATLAALGVERVDPRVPDDAARSGSAAAAIPISIQLRSQLACVRRRRRDVERRKPDRQIDNKRRDDFCNVHQGLWQESQQADHRRHAPKAGEADSANADRAAGTADQKTTYQRTVADEALMGVVKVEHLWSLGALRQWWYWIRLENPATGATP